MGTIVLACAACTALALAVDGDEVFRGFGLQGFDRPETAPDVTMSGFPAGVWKSAYDRNLDGTLTIEETTTITISGANQRLIGNYLEHQAVGKRNNSVFTGWFVPGTPPLVTFRQDDEPEYTAIYTGRLVAPNQVIGTYCDNRGFSGDWSLTLDSASEAPPAVPRPPEVRF